MASNRKFVVFALVVLIVALIAVVGYATYTAFQPKTATVEKKVCQDTTEIDVVTLAKGEYLYYDSGDHYFYNGYFEPGTYYVSNCIGHYVVSIWGADLGTETIRLTDYLTVTVTVSVSGFYYGRRPELEAFWAQSGSELTTIAKNQTFAAIAKLDSKTFTVPMDAAQKALYAKYDSHVWLNSLSSSYSNPQ